MTWVHTHYTMFFDYMSSMTVTEKVSVASLVLLVSYVYVYGSSSSFAEEMFVHDYLYDYVSIIAKKKPLFPCAPSEITNIPPLSHISWGIPDDASTQAACDWLSAYHTKGLFYEPALGSHMSNLLTALDPANRLILERVLVSALQTFFGS